MVLSNGGVKRNHHQSKLSQQLPAQRHVRVLRRRIGGQTESRENEADHRVVRYTNRQGTTFHQLRQP